MLAPVEILYNAGGSTAHMKQDSDARSTGLTVNRMSDSYFLSIADLDSVWELKVPFSLAPLGLHFIFVSLIKYLLHEVTFVIAKHF